jgi:hypothetical protein
MPRRIGQVGLQHNSARGWDDWLGSQTVGHFPDEPVSQLWQRLDVARLLRIVSERHADLVDGEVDAALEVDKGGVTPQMTLNVAAADHLSVTIEEQQENLEGLRRQFDRSSTLEELIGGTVDLEEAESDYLESRVGGCHGDVPQPAAGL